MIASAIHAGDYTDSFIPGETAEYRITWMGLPLAWSKTSIEPINEDGRELVRLRMESKSYKAYNHIYKVDDLTDVFIDPETALPVRIDLRINEGGRKRSHLTTFHHDKQIALFQDRITKEFREVPITKTTQDVYSFIYANRNTPFEQLTGKTHRLYADGKMYELGMNILEEDRITVPNHGRVECVVVEPIAEFDGMFVRKGKILFWVSKEKHRMVTCVKAKVPVGKVTAKLQTVSGSGDDFWARSRDKE
jgi:hypothetical protein